MSFVKLFQKEFIALPRTAAMKATDNYKLSASRMQRLVEGHPKMTPTNTVCQKKLGKKYDSRLECYFHHGIYFLCSELVVMQSIDINLNFELLVELLRVTFNCKIVRFGS